MYDAAGKMQKGKRLAVKNQWGLRIWGKSRDYYLKGQQDDAGRKRKERIEREIRTFGKDAIIDS